MTTTDVLIDVQAIGPNVIPVVNLSDYRLVHAGWHVAKASNALGNTSSIDQTEVRVTFGGDTDRYELGHIATGHTSELGLLVIESPSEYPDFEAIVVQSFDTRPDDLTVLPVVARTQGVHEGDTGARLYGAILHAILEMRNIRLSFERQ